MAFEPIRAVRVDTGPGFPQMDRFPEAASKTFKTGVPLTLASGFLQECAFSGADIVHSVSAEDAHNLSVAGTAQELSEGTPPNQPSAKITPIGAWMRDGNVGAYAANGKTIFSIKLNTGQTFSQALIASGVLYGLTKDATSGFWFLDTTDTSGNNAVARIVGVDPGDNTRVWIQFDASKRYFN